VAIMTSALVVADRSGRPSRVTNTDPGFLPLFSYPTDIIYPTDIVAPEAASRFHGFRGRAGHLVQDLWQK